MTPPATPERYKNHRFPAEIINQIVSLNCRDEFPQTVGRVAPAPVMCQGSEAGLDRTTVQSSSKRDLLVWPPRPDHPGPSRPRKYGDKVKLYEVFDHLHLFGKTRCQVYGALEEGSYLAVHLLWKPTGGLIRFIFALTSHGPIVLICSDLAMHPVMAIELYCVRVRVETMLAMLKHLVGLLSLLVQTAASTLPKAEEQSALEAANERWCAAGPELLGML
jgi:hypothetical protein